MAELSFGLPIYCLSEPTTIVLNYGSLVSVYQRMTGQLVSLASENIFASCKNLIEKATQGGTCNVIMCCEKKELTSSVSEPITTINVKIQQQGVCTIQTLGLP